MRFRVLFQDELASGAGCYKTVYEDAENDFGVIGSGGFHEFLLNVHYGTVLPERGGGKGPVGHTLWICLQFLCACNVLNVADLRENGKIDYLTFRIFILGCFSFQRSERNFFSSSGCSLLARVTFSSGNSCFFYVLLC